MKKTLLLTAFIAMAVLSPASADSLAVSPSRPTTTDRITFTIIIPKWDCCTIYANDSNVTLWGDTGVLLPYTSNLPQVCTMIACINVEKKLVYKSAPLKAGTYAVYELRELLCTTKICPAIAFMPVKIGSVTVTPSAGVVDRLHRAPVAGTARTDGRIGIYDIRGSLISSSGISPKVRTPGVYFVKNGPQSTRAIIVP
jgi:hypothetical protein